MTTIRRACVAGMLVAASACGGGGAGIPPGAGAIKPVGPLEASIRITVPGASSASNPKLRKRYSVAWNTAGINVSVFASPRSSNPTAIAQDAFDVSSTSANCAAAANGRTCTFSLVLPGAGTDDFVVTSYDAAPAGGSIPPGANQLGIGIDAAVTIVGGSNPLAFTIDGVLANATILPLAPTFAAAISSGAMPVYVQALDSDGSTIVADNYADANGNPVSIALALSGAAASLFGLSSPALVSPPANGVTLSYSSTNLTSNEFNNGFSLGLTATPSNGAPVANATLSLPASNAYFIGLGNKAQPNGVTLGPDGNLWFTDGGYSGINAMTPSGTYLGNILVTSHSHPAGITTGPDGNLWFTETAGNNIGVLNVATSTVTEYPTAPTANPIGIAKGPDGNLWFTEFNTSKIATINPTTLAITEYSTLTPNAGPTGIVAGPDGNLWFTETTASNIGVITTAGAMVEYSVKTPSATPNAIVAGPDGALWFTESSQGAIGRITTSGSYTEYPIPGTGHTDTLAVGSDGNIWASSDDYLFRVTTSGVPTIWANPAGASSPITGMTLGPDGNVYYLMSATSGGNAAVGRITI